MNSTFSKMAPYIKLLLDILTGNRISLSCFPSFVISFFPFLFSLSLSPPQPVRLSRCLLLNSAKTPAFSLHMCAGELFQLSRVSWSGVPHNLGTSVWKQLGGNFKNQWSPWRYHTSLGPTKEPAGQGGDEQLWDSRRCGLMACAWAREQMSTIGSGGTSLLLGHHQHLATE